MAFRMVCSAWHALLLAMTAGVSYASPSDEVCAVDFAVMFAHPLIQKARSSSVQASATWAEPPQRGHMRELGGGDLMRPSRIVFSLTTTKSRIQMIKPVLDAIVGGQTHPPDAVYLAIPPSVEEIPAWLSQYDAMSSRPGILKLVRMKADYGPASKLLAAVREGGERSITTIVVYGDDDVLYGSRVVELHLKAQAAATRHVAFGSRLISIGEGSKRERVIEGIGSVSIRAGLLPDVLFSVGHAPDACRLSDDYWFSHYFAQAGVSFMQLPECSFDWASNTWPATCGTPFETLPQVQHKSALSETVLSRDGTGLRQGGDWRSQLQRYEVCQEILARNGGTPNGSTNEHKLE